MMRENGKFVHFNLKIVSIFTPEIFRKHFTGHFHVLTWVNSTQLTFSSRFLPGFFRVFFRFFADPGMWSACVKEYFSAGLLPLYRVFFRFSSARKRIWPCRKVFGRKPGRTVEKRQPGTCRYTAVFGIFISEILPYTVEFR